MPIPVIDIAQMRAWEHATWATGQTEEAVIQRAGQAVAAVIQGLVPPHSQILVLAGMGHNGDDALAAAGHLSDRHVIDCKVSNPEFCMPLVQRHLARRPALVVDGLFGIGLNRPLDPAWCALVQAINDSGLPVAAVDVPSGLHADTGEPQGGAVQAQVTITLGAPKKGLLQTQAAPYVGRLEVAPDIGLVPCPHTGELWWTLPRDFAGYPPPRPAGGHKGTFGHLVIVAGSLGYHGAAVLATRAALCAKPGLVTLQTLPEVYVPVAAQLQLAMVHPWRSALAAPESATAWLFGPGLAQPDLPEALRAECTRAWQAARLPVVVDASALDWLPEGPLPHRCVRLITPHPGEAARLLGTTTAVVQQDRPAALRQLSRRFGGCWVALKGQQTLLGQAEGPLHVNPSGNPGLAQGGSGDALAGCLAGLLAQPLLQADPGRAMRYGLWWHGHTADQLQARGGSWTIDTLLRQWEGW
jgi:hydroxyethylthiazole kinase-like uncharacterized protein yjeF